MSGLVVDASVSAAWFLPDEATLFTEAVLKATATSEVWVPALWMLEIGNLLLSAQRRKRIGEAKRRELVAAAAALRPYGRKARLTGLGRSARELLHHETPPVSHLLLQDPKFKCMDCGSGPQ